MQSYKQKPDTARIREISGYCWLILIISQEEIGARLGLSKSYVKHIPMFREYLELQEHRHKKAYIYEYLADKYSMHPQSVKRVIAKILRTEHV
jgi:hypothetical protein